MTYEHNGVEYETTDEFRVPKRGEFWVGPKDNVIGPGGDNHIPIIRREPRTILRARAQKPVTVYSSPALHNSWPVEVVFEEGGDSRLLSVEEAEDLVNDLREEIASVKEHRDGPFVRVKVVGYAGQFTYRDPSRSLQEGDKVEVPYGHNNRLRTGTVVAHGRGGYNGPTKDVAARLTREEL